MTGMKLSAEARRSLAEHADRLVKSDPYAGLVPGPRLPDLSTPEKRVAFRERCDAAAAHFREAPADSPSLPLRMKEIG